MNKRQIKKQDLKTQVDILFNSTSSTLALANRTKDHLNKVVEMDDKNFEVIGKDIGTIINTLESVTEIQKDVVPEIFLNGFAILGMQKHIKSLWKISIIQSLAIIVLSIALVWKG